MERFIDVDEVIATAASTIKNMSDEEMLLAKQWVWMAIRKIGPSSDTIITADVDVIDKTIEIPDNCVSNGIIDLAIYDNLGREIKYRFHKGGDKRTHLKEYKDDCLLNIYQDDKFIHLSDSNYDPSTARIKYYSFPLDECGLPKIPEPHLFPIMMFIRWMMALRNSPASPFELSTAERNWREALDVAKSRNKAVSVLQAKEIARTWTSLMPNPSFNRF